MLVCAMILYGYMKSFSNDVNNLFDNTKYIRRFITVLFT